MSTRKFAAQSGTSAGGLGRYQLDVTARDVADLVLSAGGWLFDRAMAGWEVNVVLTTEGDPRPLQILGVRSGRRELSADASAPPRAIAASNGAIADDPELRANVLLAMKRGVGDVLLWGTSWPEGVERGVDRVEHELTSAARAFKGYALAAAGLTDTVGPTEAFLGRIGFLAGYSDLTPSVATSFAQR